MRKLEINFDLIDKAYEAKGEHNVRRWFRVNKLYDVAGAIVPATQLTMALAGVESPEEALIKSVILTAMNFGLWASLDKTLEYIRTKATGISPRQKAWLQLFVFTEILRRTVDIDTTVDNIMQADIYHKKYKLATDGKPGIIEYSELPEEMVEEVDEHGDLVFGDVNILSHLYNIEALEVLADKEMPYHIAEKKSEYLDENGNLVEPENKNVYKFEAFIFDAFANFDDMSIMRVKREEEFAPIKNKEGNDSPETAVKLYNARD